MKKIVALLLVIGGLFAAFATTQPVWADQPAIGVNVQWPGSGGYYPQNGYPATYPTPTNVYYPTPGYQGQPYTNNGYGNNTGSCNNGYSGNGYGSNGYGNGRSWNQRRAWREHEVRERELRERRERERREHHHGR